MLKHIYIIVKFVYECQAYSATVCIDLYYNVEMVFWKITNKSN